MREAAVLDPEFRAESESGLKSAQSPEGKDEKFSQSPAAEMRCVLAGWLLAELEVVRGLPSRGWRPSGEGGRWLGEPKR